MTDFEFTATASCDYCGNLLSSSDEECDNCSSEEVEQHVFRKIRSDSSEIVLVRATMSYKWDRLEEVVDDWKSYEWLGPRGEVRSMVGRNPWPSVEDVPRRAMPHDKITTGDTK
jgi:hypothetical protein